MTLLRNVHADGFVYARGELIAVLPRKHFRVHDNSVFSLGFKVSTPIFDGANENDIMDTLELANDYVNTPLEEFEAKYKDILAPEVMEFLLGSCHQPDGEALSSA